MNRTLSRQTLAALAASTLMAANLAAIDWSAYSAENVEESAGAAVHLEVGLDPSTYGLGYTYGVRLVGAPYIGSDFGGWLTYDADGEALFGAPTLTFWVIPPAYRLAPVLGFGGSYQFCFSDGGGGAAATAPDGTRYDDPATSHWSFHAIGGLRLRLKQGQYIDLNAVWRRPLLDLAPDQEENRFGIRLSLGYEL